MVLLLAAAIMVRLGIWQWDRGKLRSAANDAVEAAQTRDPVPAGTLIPATPDQPPAGADEWSQVTLTGTYDPDGTILIRQRTFETGVGFEIVVPFTADDGATYLIDRGYALATGGAAQAPDVPPAPTGETTVIGIVKVPYTADPNATRVEHVGPYKSVRALDPEVLSDALGVPLAGGYIVATDESTADGAAIEDINRIPPPELTDGPHLSYAVQWWIFAGMTLFVFGYLARREAITRLLADEDLDDDLDDFDDAGLNEGDRDDVDRDAVDRDAMDSANSASLNARPEADSASPPITIRS